MVDKNDDMKYEPELIAILAYKTIVCEYNERYTGKHSYPMLHCLSKLHSLDPEQERLLRQIEKLLTELDDSG